jgi:hypothetical protein
MLGYIKTFAPWIAFAALSTNGQYRYGALAGLLIALALLVLDRRQRKPWDALIIESSSAIFFGALTVATFAISPAPFGDYGPAAAGAWLALTAWGSLAIHKPFTLGIAKTMVPEQFHSNPIFYRTNAIITSVWAAAFTCESAATTVLLTVAPHATTALVVLKVCSFVLPAAFTVRYSQIVRNRQETNR